MQLLLVHIWTSFIWIVLTKPMLTLIDPSTTWKPFIVLLFGDLLLSLLKKILHTRRPLVEVNVVYCVSFFYLILLILYILHHRVSHYEKKTKGKTWLVVLKVRRTSRSKTKQPHWLSRSLSSRLGRGKSFQAILTLVIFQDIEVLRNKSLIRLLLPRFQSFRP